MAVMGCRLQARIRRGEAILGKGENRGKQFHSRLDKQLLWSGVALKITDAIVTSFRYLSHLIIIFTIQETNKPINYYE